MTAEPRDDVGMDRLLVVEDDRSLRGTLVAAVAGAGYEVADCGDGIAAAQKLRAERFDLVLLDIGLPFVDGWRVLNGLDRARVPSVIVISARGDEHDKVRALDLGADDYLAKPFGVDELLARIRAVLRRAAPAAESPGVVTEGTVRVDLEHGTVLRDSREVALSQTEYRLLAQLAQHQGEVLGYRALLGEVWGAGYADERNYLRTFVQRLRSKLEDDPSAPRVITTIPGRGYRFGGPPAPDR